MSRAFRSRNKKAHEPSAFSRELEKLRKLLGLSKADLIDSLGVSAPSVWHWEHQGAKGTAPSAEIYIRLGILAAGHPQGNYLWFLARAGLDQNATSRLVSSLTERLKKSARPVAPTCFIPVLRDATYAGQPALAPDDQVELRLPFLSAFVTHSDQTFGLRVPDHLASLRFRPFDLRSPSAPSAVIRPSIRQTILNPGDIVVIDCHSSAIEALSNSIVAVNVQCAEEKRAPHHTFARDGIFVGYLHAGPKRDASFAGVIPIVVDSMGHGERIAFYDSKRGSWVFLPGCQLLGRVICWLESEKHFRTGSPIGVNDETKPF